jgi:membrane protein DedA with SNARE-associated domain
VAAVTTLASITQTLTDSVANNGVAAVFILMAVDALLPVGGELIMVVAGAIAARAISGHPHLIGHALAPGLETYLVLAAVGTLGYLAGSMTGWLIGRRVGADWLERHGHLLHLGPANLVRAEKWFERHGATAVFLGRLTPLVRSFISIPAGLFGEPFARYVVLTLLASAIWCFGFAGLGWGLGSSYKNVDHITHIFEAALVVAAVGALGWLVWRRRPST